jgi:putative spermidine/putrescine transport system substrate-binding protein
VTATPQTIALLQTGEVDFSFTYANRVKASNEPRGGKRMAISLEQNLLISEPLVRLKGAPSKENAMRYLAYHMHPEVQARISDASGLVPNSKRAMPMLSAEARKWTPNLENGRNLVMSGVYWTANFEAVSGRFKEWALS